MSEQRIGWRTLDWLRRALALYVDHGSPSDPTLNECPARDLHAIALEIGPPPDELRALAVIEGMHVALDHAAIAVLLADSQRQLAMTWGMDIADGLAFERACHAIEVRNLRADVASLEGSIARLRAELERLRPRTVDHGDLG